MARCDDFDESVEDDSDYAIAKRVIGGHRVSPNQFPYAVSLKGDFPGTHKSTYCGASIIASRWLLTAAHCFSGKTQHNDTWVKNVLTFYEANITTHFCYRMINPKYWSIQGGSTVIDVSAWIHLTVLRVVLTNVKWAFTWWRRVEFTIYSKFIHCVRSSKVYI